ncbi:hypothetical protein ABW286_03205 [Erwinia papayae]|uniref:Topoisomerase II n=2 Tax=Erwinia TaxID=551 RepID=A0A014NLX8_9GAMM|nr:hypothetical protein [Erwinia mallotivora]EXU74775.1 hypothetical protein BG55_13570 [Erwinia mallotivora]
MTFFAGLIVFICGIAALLILILLHKRKKISTTLAVWLAIVLIAVSSTYYVAVRVPHQQHEARLNAAEHYFINLPLYRTLKVQQPSLYQKLHQQYLSAVATGESEAQALEHLRPMLADLLSQRISYASNEALYRYMQVSLEQMKALRQQNSELCFKFLFPQVSGGINTTESLPVELRKKEGEALDYFLQQSFGAEHTGNALQGREDLGNIVRSLYGRWGSDLQLINAPAETGADKTKLCEMTIDLYQSVLALPVNHSAEVLRIILDGNANW